MPGVRLRHDTLRDKQLAITHPTKKYKAPVMCTPCGKVHTHKTIHVPVGNDGTFIVSEQVLTLLKQCGLPAMHVENSVSAPPAQVVNLNAPPQVYVEEEVKYEGRAKRLFVLKNRIR